VAAGHGGGVWLIAGKPRGNGVAAATVAGVCCPTKVKALEMDADVEAVSFE